MTTRQTVHRLGPGPTFVVAGDKLLSQTLGGQLTLAGRLPGIWPPARSSKGVQVPAVPGRRHGAHGRRVGRGRGRRGYDLRARYRRPLGPGQHVRDRRLPASVPVSPAQSVLCAVGEVENDRMGQRNPPHRPARADPPRRKNRVHRFHPRRPGRQLYIVPIGKILDHPPATPIDGP